MTNPRAQGVADLLDVATKATVAAANKIAEDKRMSQMSKGKAHPLWLLGHVTNTLSGAVNTVALGGRPTAPKEYAKMFAPDFLGGAPIESDASVYPAWKDVLAEYEKAAATAIAAIRELEDGDLDGSCKGNVPEPVKDFFAVLGTTLNSFVLHDTHHKGQMALLGAME